MYHPNDFTRGEQQQVTSPNNKMFHPAEVLDLPAARPRASPAPARLSQ